MCMCVCVATPVILEIRGKYVLFIKKKHFEGTGRSSPFVGGVGWGWGTLTYIDWVGQRGHSPAMYLSFSAIYWFRRPMGILAFNVALGLSVYLPISQHRLRKWLVAEQVTSNIKMPQSCTSRPQWVKTSGLWYEILNIQGSSWIWPQPISDDVTI